jgi:pentose-5-phosphate-3-epimerase
MFTYMGQATPEDTLARAMRHRDYLKSQETVECDGGLEREHLSGLFLASAWLLSAASEASLRSNGDFEAFPAWCHLE